MEKSKSLQEVDWDREEVRAIFAVGIIATLLASLQSPSYQTIYGISFTLTIVSLLYTWGSYTFFMALGVSRDWIGNFAAKGSRLVARLCFLIGIGSVVGTLTTVALILFMDHFDPQFLASALGFLTVVWTLESVTVAVTGLLAASRVRDELRARRRSPIAA